MIQQNLLGKLKHDITHKGVTAWLLSYLFIAFYVVLYFGSGKSFQKVSLHSSYTWLFLGLLAGVLVLAIQVIQREKPIEQAIPTWLEWLQRGNVHFLVLYLLFAFLVPNDKSSLEGMAWLLLLGLALGCFGFSLFFFVLESKERKAIWKQDVFFFFPLWAVAWGVVKFVLPAWVEKQSLPLHIQTAFYYGGAFVLFFSSVVVLLQSFSAKNENQKEVFFDYLKFVLLAFLVFLIPWLFVWFRIEKDFLHDWSVMIFGQKMGNRWMLYGTAYTVIMTLGGAYMIWKYRHNRYQIVRTCVVVFVQIVFAFSIPGLLKMAGKPDYYFTYIWPLKIDYFYPSMIAYQVKSGLPIPIVLYSFVAGLIIAPLLAIVFGKRWYCSWVCGCGGLANTLGEPWRHLSSKSSTSWKIEKVTIHAVLFFSLLVTGITLLEGLIPKGDTVSLGLAGENLRYLYGVLISAVLSGVVGVGLYPIGGTRVWCRFACPMAALLGLLQKLGRFRIKVKRDMCISCGMCSKYCEMGIDVRSYAQSNESFTRASCVGCGLCAEVCPRGVLRLESVSKKDPQEINLIDILEGWKGEDLTISAKK